MSDEHNSKETQGQGMEQKVKRDIIKTVGAGLGIAGLASLMGGQAVAADEGTQRYILVATHGGNDPAFVTILPY